MQPRSNPLCAPLFVAAWLMLAVAPARATGHPDAAAIASQGNGRGAPACAACHGADGGGQAAAGFPRLAGLNAAYLQRRLDDIASSARGAAVMKPIAASLSESERKALAVYYAKMPVAPAPASAASAAGDARGEWLATRGDWSRQLPGCVQCHGPRGVGVGAYFPPLAGQPATYLAGQMRAFKEGSRNDPLGMMRHVASSLDDTDTDAVAAWFAAQADRAAPSDAPVSGAKTSVPAAVAAVAGRDSDKAGKPIFAPPPESAIPNDAFGAMVRKGERIFLHTRQYAGQYVGNDLDCGSCHLDAGRRADAVPLWGAWGMYPQYRRKNGHVNTFAERLQDCFMFSMNGKAPPADSEAIVALSSYAYWLAQGAPTGMKLSGAGYLDLGAPPQTPDYRRGEAVFTRACALCHGADGRGQKAAGVFVFPPLWGAGSFNWGAGMQAVNTAAGFIKANMPFSRGGTLTDQDAWDVAYFMDAHERPQDPRYTGDAAATRKLFHDNQWSLYGTQVNGHWLGSGVPDMAPPRSRGAQ